MFLSGTVMVFLSCLSREPELVLLDVQSVAAGQEGWLAFDVTTASNHWLLQPRSNLGIRLYVETEEGGLVARVARNVFKDMFELHFQHCVSSLLCPTSDRSLSAGWIGLVGRRGPRSKQPFMVTFFRENQVPCRPPRAVKPHARRKKPKYDLPLPSIRSKAPHFVDQKIRLGQIMINDDL